ncbi:phage tail length tape measure family protein, partial [Escherichia coli]
MFSHPVYLFLREFSLQDFRGGSVDKVAEAFGKLTTDPTSGLIAMARQFRNVTAEQIAYV